MKKSFDRRNKGRMPRPVVGGELLVKKGSGFEGPFKVVKLHHRDGVLKDVIYKTDRGKIEVASVRIPN